MSVGGAATAERTVRLTVERLTSAGDGVARLPDGKVAFVPRAVPGDEIEAQVVEDRASFARARLVSLLRPGEARREAPCALYDLCGGCTLQHVSYEEQLAWKGRFVSDALERIGGIEVPPPPVAPSPRELRYRNRMAFTLRRLRGGGIVAGLHERERPTRVVDVHGECLLPEEGLLLLWTSLREAWGPGARLLPEGGRLRLEIRVDRDGAGALHVRGGASGWDGGGLTEVVPGLDSVWHRAAGEDAWLRVAPGTELRSGGAASPAFVQVNRQAARAVVDRVLAAAPAGEEAGRAVDAYCGTAVYGRELAARGWRVIGLEGDSEACAAARAGAPEGLEVREGRVEELLAEALPTDLAIVNPPRTGLDPRVPELLAGRPPDRIVYVSCDAATLARDLSRLAPRFRVTDVSAFDLFPQTAHVESVVVLDLA